jgi:hypothetical protein
MTQGDVERAIGRLLTDARFRRAFRTDAAAAARSAGLQLSDLELQALAAMPFAALPRFAARIDARIRRLSIPVRSRQELSS